MFSAGSQIVYMPGAAASRKGQGTLYICDSYSQAAGFVVRRFAMIKANANINAANRTKVAKDEPSGKLVLFG
jgi:hypothetical protein